MKQTILKNTTCHDVITGRVDVDAGPAAGQGSLPLTLSWPASSVTTRFRNSDSVQVSFQPVQPFPGVFNPVVNNSFRFDIDGNASERFIAASGSWSITGLSLDPHELTVTKLTEAIYGVSVLQSIDLAPGGR